MGEKQSQNQENSENQQEVKQNQEEEKTSKVIWWVIGIFGFLGVLLFFVLPIFLLVFYESLPFSSIFSPPFIPYDGEVLLVVKAKDIRVLEGDKFRTTITLTNDSDKKIKVSQISFIGSELGESYEINLLHPPAKSHGPEEFCEEEFPEYWPPNKTFDLRPSIKLKPYESKRIEVEVQAVKIGSYIVGVEAIGGSFLEPIGNSSFKILIKPKSEK